MMDNYIKLSNKNSDFKFSLKYSKNNFFSSFAKSSVSFSTSRAITCYAFATLPESLSLSTALATLVVSTTLSTAFKTIAPFFKSFIASLTKLTEPFITRF